MFSKRVAVCCVSGLLALTIAACGGQSQSTPTSTSETESASKAQSEKKADNRQVLGTESKDAIEVALTNGLNGDITSLSMRVSGEEAFGDNLIAKDGKVTSGEEVRLFVGKSDKEGATYDIRVILEDSTDAIDFIEVPLVDVKEAMLKQDDGVAFVEYVGNDGASGSTKEAALDRKAKADEAAQAEANNASAVVTTSTENGGGSQGGSQNYYEPVATEVAEPVEYVAPEPAAPAETTAAPAQSEDACVDDPVLRY